MQEIVQEKRPPEEIMAYTYGPVGIHIFHHLTNGLYSVICVDSACTWIRICWSFDDAQAIFEAWRSAREN